jgi:hypothetical protein
MLLFLLYVVPDFCVLLRRQGKTAKCALGVESVMALLRNLSHFECSAVVANEPQLSVCAWTDPSIRIGSSSERTLRSAQIRARALCAIAADSGTVQTIPGRDNVTR